MGLHFIKSHLGYRNTYRPISAHIGVGHIEGMAHMAVVYGNYRVHSDHLHLFTETPHMANYYAPPPLPVVNAPDILITPEEVPNDKRAAVDILVSGNQTYSHILSDQWTYLKSSDSCA